MTISCSGKTTFASQYRTYHGIKVVDFTKIGSLGARRRGESKVSPEISPMAYLQRFASNTKKRCLNLIQPLTGKEAHNPDCGLTYNEEVIRYLHKQKQSVIVLGRPCYYATEALKGIHYAVVLIPLEQHKHYRENRARVKGNAAPFADIERWRNQLQEHAIAHHIPIYDSFSSAIDAAICDERLISQ